MDNIDIEIKFDSTKEAKVIRNNIEINEEVSLLFDKNKEISFIYYNEERIGFLTSKNSRMLYLMGVTKAHVSKRIDNKVYLTYNDNDIKENIDVESISMKVSKHLNINKEIMVKPGFHKEINVEENYEIIKKHREQRKWKEVDKYLEWFGRPYGEDSKRKTCIIDDNDFNSSFYCTKELWLDRYNHSGYVFDIPQSIIANSRMAKEVAKNYFYGNTEEVTKDWAKNLMVDKTNEYLKDSSIDTICNATFNYCGLVTTIDMLHKEFDGTFTVVSVKSSTAVKDEHYDLMGYQYYVLSNCNVDIKRVIVLYINNEYERHGELDVKRLFLEEDVTLESDYMYESVESHINSLVKVLQEKEEPEQKIGIFCENPFKCPFFDYCRKDLPENNIFSLKGMWAKYKYEYYNSGIESFEDILNSGIALSDRTRIQILSTLNNGEPVVDEKAIENFIDTLEYPIYHLDFETIQFAVPQYESSKPWQQIPFQYSLHIEYADGKLEHKEFLAEVGKDPRRKLAERLCKDIPKGACSLAYNMSFEKTRIKELAELFPDLKDHLMDIYYNMKDLMIPFKYLSYYCESMKGSYSIKYVLPAMCPNDPELDYHNLDQVHNGIEAQAAFIDLANKSEAEIQETRENLLKYCGLDTYAMVKVLNALKDKLEEK